MEKLGVSEAQLRRAVDVGSFAMMAVGAAVYVALHWQTAAYGRHAKPASGGAHINAKLAWMTQEMWSAVLPICLFLLSTKSLGQYRTALFLMFELHYIWRSTVYPLLMKQAAPMPLHVWGLASLFCMYNGALQGLALVYDDRAAKDVTPRFIAGALLWLLGLLINIQSDLHLQQLRAKRGRGYFIPQGGCFALVSCANYFGEVVEWIGFAVAAWSLPAAAFALFTFCNLAPRAKDHHRWYKEKFLDYPQSRKAIIPFLL